MIARSRAFISLDELRDYVYQTLCRVDQLVPGAFEMSQRVLVRGEKPCGMYFCLHGPRSVKYTAIWETDRGNLFFYGPTGERFLREEIVDAPALAAA